jgi:hypothetical protein
MTHTTENPSNNASPASARGTEPRSVSDGWQLKDVVRTVPARVGVSPHATDTCSRLLRRRVFLPGV